MAIHIWDYVIRLNFRRSLGLPEKRQRSDWWKIIIANPRVQPSVRGMSAGSLASLTTPRAYYVKFTHSSWI